MDLFGNKKREAEIASIKSLVKEQAETIRSFSGAKINRFNKDFVSSAIKTNEDIKASGSILRTRSRELAKNNGDYRKWLRMCQRNIIGHTGFKLQMNIKLASGEKDEYANSLFEEEQRIFAKKGNCTCDRKMSLRTFDKLLIRSLFVDGEIFERRVRGFKNRHKIAYQLLDPAACPYDLNSVLPNGNTIRMGIEYDEWRSPVAYWFKAGKAESYFAYEPVYNPKPGAEYVRFPADEINHVYFHEFTNQDRGFPFGQAAMQNIYLLGGYFYTELVAADVASRKMGAYINKSGSAGNYGGRNNGENGKDADGTPAAQTTTISATAEPASFDVLYGDWDFKMFDPAHPAGNFEPFVKAQKRNEANGLDVAYNTFANDLENVNFSSIRAGVLDERDAWLDLQELYKEEIKQPDFEIWLEMQLLRSDIPYRHSAFDRLNNARFFGRRWPWVDPKKDGEAAILQVALGSTTPQDVAANLGNDFEENIERIQEAVKKLAPVREYVSLITDMKKLFDVSPKDSKDNNTQEKEDEKEED